MPARPIRLLLVGIVVVACQADVAERPGPVADEAVVAEQSAESSPASPEAVASPTGSASAIPTPQLAPPTTKPATPPPPLEQFALDLYEQGDFVPQHTFEWCVGASIQMAHNLVSDDTRSSFEDQQALWELARDHSSNAFGGANPRGWATALTEIGLGPYTLVSIPEYDEALRVAATAIRETDRAVGLVMWRGRHAWVMSGFESIGDPAIHADFRVTGVRVLDPLYPHGSGTWGPSPEPNTLLAPEELAAQFVVREPRRWSSELSAGYLLVLPAAGA